LVAVAGRRILTLVYGREYAGETAAFLWLAVAAGLLFVASALGHGMTAARRFAIQAPLFAAVALVLVLACWVLVPRFGLTGAAAAGAVAANAQVLGSAAIVARLQRARVEGGAA
jgi:O-antigen/teichoic acid export membrane protein